MELFNLTSNKGKSNELTKSLLCPFFVSDKKLKELALPSFLVQKCAYRTYRNHQSVGGVWCVVVLPVKYVRSTTEGAVRRSLDVCGSRTQTGEKLHAHKQQLTLDNPPVLP
jgi:hypothetical protein